MQRGKEKGLAVTLYESAFGDALGESLHPGGQGLTARVAEIAGLSKDARVLDIACGRGTTACFLYKEYGCHVTGMDLSDKQIATARASAQGLGPRVGFAVADTMDLPWKDSTFDAAISECAFSLVPDKARAAREINRVLKAGARLVLTDVVLRGEIDPETQTPSSFAACIAGAKPLDGYIRILEGAGFHDPHTEDHSVELKKMAYRILLRCGSMDDDYARIADGTRESPKRDHTTDWGSMFKQARPGYALIAMTRQ
jgi:ubiquinone/menaquinone biosynthesis C-methylase UbiE